MSGPARHEVGATVVFDGEPGSALFPLDAEGFAARARVLEDRNKLQRNMHARQVQTYRRGLTPTLIRMLDAAEAEFGGQS